MPMINPHGFAGGTTGGVGVGVTGGIVGVTVGVGVGVGAAAAANSANILKCDTFAVAVCATVSTVVGRSTHLVPSYILIVSSAPAGTSAGSYVITRSIGSLNVVPLGPKS